MMPGYGIIPAWMLLSYYRVSVVMLIVFEKACYFMKNSTEYMENFFVMHVVAFSTEQIKFFKAQFFFFLSYVVVCVEVLFSHGSSFIDYR
jgi:NADH:ubiquinone oxidoreductase subunit K